MRRFPLIGPHVAYSIKTAFTALLMVALASCSSEEAGFSAIQKAVKERVVSAFGEKLKEKGSATADIKGSNVTISVSGKSSPVIPSKPPGGEIVFIAEGANDITFQMTARESVTEVEKFYRATFAREGLIEKDMTSAGGLFKGEWANPDGKPRAYVYAYGDEGSQSRIALALVKR
jgi:lysophospholipase L1-like esterase